MELLRALEQVEAADAPGRLTRLLEHLQQHPSLSAAQLLLDVPHALWTDAAWVALREAVARASGLFGTDPQRQPPGEAVA